MSEPTRVDSFYQQIEHINPADRKILMRYYQTIKDLPRFDEQDNQASIALYKAEQNPAVKKQLKNKIIEGNLYQVLSLLTKHFYYETNSKFSLDDMIQLTNLTLIECIDNYIEYIDNIYNTNKKEFYYFISGYLYSQLRHYINYSTSPFEFPEYKVKMAKAFSLLTKGYSDEEITISLKMGKKTLRGIKFIQQGQVLLGNPVLPEAGKDITDIEDKVYSEYFVKKFFSELTPRQEDILRRLYFESAEKKTIRAVGKDLGVTNQDIQDLKNKAFMKVHRICYKYTKE